MMTDTFDLKVFHAINGMAAPGLHPTLDHFMAFIAQYALEMYAVLFVIAWFVLPKNAFHKRNGLLVALFSGILALVINFLISHLIWYRQRPFVQFPNDDNVLISHSSDASFPSDHGSGSSAFAFGSFGVSRLLSWLFTILAVLTLISRVYVGVHFPTDVLAGVGVGLISNLIMRKLSRILHPLTNWACKICRFGTEPTRSMRGRAQ